MKWLNRKSELLKKDNNTMTNYSFAMTKTFPTLKEENREMMTELLFHRLLGY